MSRARTRHRRHEPERRDALVRLLAGRSHAPFRETLLGFPAALRGARPRGAPHTPWELLEHLRIAQRDILDFGRDPEHPSPPWPEGYWPPSAAPPGPRAWGRSANAFLRDLRALVAVARDPGLDLDAPLPGTRTTWFGQLSLAACHNSYHLGQLLLLRRMLAGAPRAKAGRKA
jgi:hypothetical protein